MKKKTKKIISRKQFKGTTKIVPSYKTLLTNQEYNFVIELQVLCDQSIKQKAIIELNSSDSKQLSKILSKVSRIIF